MTKFWREKLLMTMATRYGPRPNAEVWLNYSAGIMGWKYFEKGRIRIIEVEAE